jgi:hypothetical protein
VAAAQSLNASSWVSLDLCEPEHTVSRGDKGDHTILCSLVATEPAATVRVARAVLPQNRFLAALLLTTYKLTSLFVPPSPRVAVCIVIVILVLLFYVSLFKFEVHEKWGPGQLSNSTASFLLSYPVGQADSPRLTSGNKSLVLERPHIYIYTYTVCVCVCLCICLFYVTLCIYICVYVCMCVCVFMYMFMHM